MANGPMFGGQRKPQYEGSPVEGLNEQQYQQAHQGMPAPVVGTYDQLTPVEQQYVNRPILGGASSSGQNFNVGSPGYSAGGNYFGPIPYPEYQSVLTGGSHSAPGSGTFIGRPNLDGTPTMGNTPGQIGLPTELTMQSQYDPQYLEDLQAYATAEGPSDWLQLQQQQIASEGATLRDTLEKQRLGGLAEAREGLATRRGLTTGAGERLEMAGMDAKMMENQRISRELGEQDRMMRIAEEQAKIGVLEKLPGYEAQRAGYETGVDQMNIANIMDERQREFQAQMDAYKYQMGAWGDQQVSLS